ncbi:MAG: bifunctional oligoribonuclease/PAP phosphatase NrnA [Calditrichaeota bacterium]|nr:MAG: bifunctional oligoribonuclease/PAP phosphatase NrnA [Calditrichota bacterium]
MTERYSLQNSESLDRVCRNILQFVRSQDNFLITTHLSADGDAYASTLAMAYLLEAWQKRYRIIFQDQEKEWRYQFMWGWDKIEGYQEGMQANFQAAIVLDVPSRARIGEPARLLPAPLYCVKIDHHPSEDEFTTYNLVNTQASSTSQLVYEVIVRSGIAFSNELATLMFSGIMYDTGRFSFSNTSKRDFEIAAHLAQYGIQPYEIANQLFFSNSFSGMKTIGYGLAHMESHLNGKLCVIYLPHKVVAANSASEVEELANYSVAIHGVEVGIYMREPEPGLLKISFRSKGRVNVNRVAKVFGGGGHDHAAGCRVRGEAAQIRRQIIQEVQKQLEELGLL